jgi:hypothetical protein
MRNGTRPGFRTEIEVELPKGYVDEAGTLHRRGTMRPVTTADEIYIGIARPNALLSVDGSPSTRSLAGAGSRPSSLSERETKRRARAAGGNCHGRRHRDLGS